MNLWFSDNRAEATHNQMSSATKKTTLLKFTVIIINMINSPNSVVNLTCVSILCKLDCHVRLLCNGVKFFFQSSISNQTLKHGPEVDSLLTL